MALSDFTLLVKILELDVETHKIVKQFDKSERHVFAADIRHTIADIEHLVIRATKEQLAERQRHIVPEGTRALLHDVDVELEYLKLQQRKAFSLRLINEKCYERWSARVLEIGRILGAWIKQNDTALAKTKRAVFSQNKLI